MKINPHRELYPALLRKGDRGKFHDIANIPGQYGEQVGGALKKTVRNKEKIGRDRMGER